MFGSIFNTIGNVIGSVGSAAGKVAGSTASAIGSTAGSIGSAAWQMPGQVIKGVGDVIESLPKTAEAYKPVVDVLGSAYGVYTSIQQNKAAKKAADSYGSGSAQGGAIGNVPVYIPSASAPSMSVTTGNPAMTEDERLMREAMQQGGADTQKFLVYGAIGLAAYALLSKKKR